MKKSWLIIVVYFLAWGHSSMAETLQPYGSVVAFSESKNINYPDFSIRFIGIKETPVPHITWTMKTYQFEVKTKDSTQQIGWSAGKGIVAERKFEVNGSSFALELGYSKMLGKWIGKNEMVVTTWEAFNQKKRDMKRKFRDKQGVTPPRIEKRS